MDSSIIHIRKFLRNGEYEVLMERSKLTSSSIHIHHDRWNECDSCNKINLLALDNRSEIDDYEPVVVVVVVSPM